MRRATDRQVTLHIEAIMAHATINKNILPVFVLFSGMQ